MPYEPQPESDLPLVNASESNGDDQSVATAVPDPVEERFFDGALRRIVWVMAVSIAVLTPLAYGWVGRKPAASFFVGAAVALFNFAMLRKVVASIADQTIPTYRARRIVVLRSLLRYGLVAVAFYAILRGSAVNLYGFIAGLSLPVFAIFVEAGYELFHVFRGR